MTKERRRHSALRLQKLSMPGADPDIEEGGGHTQSGVGAAMRRAQPAQFVVHASDNAKRCMGVWGHAPPGKVLNFDHMRVLLRPSETTITTQNLWQVDCNLGDSSYGRFLEPPSLRNHSEPLYVRYCRCCLLGADLSALCLQDMKQ